MQTKQYANEPETLKDKVCTECDMMIFMCNVDSFSSFFLVLFS
jgi:hypothetical protein